MNPEKTVWRLLKSLASLDLKSDGARPAWAQIDPKAPSGAHSGRAPSGRVRDGLRLSSRFLLHAGRREALKHDASLGYVRNVDAARVSQGRRYTMFDCGQTVNES